jgi:hypothetical protein
MDRRVAPAPPHLNLAGLADAAVFTIGAVDYGNVIWVFYDGVRRWICYLLCGLENPAFTLQICCSTRLGRWTEGACPHATQIYFSTYFANIRCGSIAINNPFPRASTSPF